MQLENKKIKIVYNKNYKLGMTSSIQSGVRASSSTSSGYMICLADMPFIDFNEFNFVLEQYYNSKDSQIIIIPTYQGQKGNPVIFSNSYKNLILSHQNPNGCSQIVKKNYDNVILVEMNSDNILIDLDKPSDYQDLIKKNKIT